MHTNLIAGLNHVLNEVRLWNRVDVVPQFEGTDDIFPIDHQATGWDCIVAILAIAAQRAQLADVFVEFLQFGLEERENVEVRTKVDASSLV